MSVNKAIIIGRLGRDPELKHTQGGQSVANMSLATDSVWTDKSGQRQERTEWHRIVVWGRDAENCAQYLQKGSLAYVEGRIETREYQDKDGARRWTTEIIAERVRFLGAKDQGQEDGRGGAQGGRSAAGPRGPSAGDQGRPDDDIPFAWLLPLLPAAAAAVSLLHGGGVA